MFPGFNRGKRSTISNGDWDRDGVKNKKDCEPLNWKMQDGGYNEITGIKNRAIERCPKCRARKYAGKCPNCDEDYMEDWD